MVAFLVVYLSNLRMMVLIFETCCALKLFLVENLFGDPVDRDAVPTKDQVYLESFVLVILVKSI